MLPVGTVLCISTTTWIYLLTSLDESEVTFYYIGQEAIEYVLAISSGFQLGIPYLESGASTSHNHDTLII